MPKGIEKTKGNRFGAGNHRTGDDAGGRNLRGKKAQRKGWEEEGSGIQKWQGLASF